ncbi:MAG: hypothetical protein L0212_06110 [Acidobacteria bacterium]|nr:hypothetical protein [Acidobacteriota bacterium]
MRNALAAAVVLLVLSHAAPAPAAGQPAPSDRLQARMVTDEPEAVLAILEKRKQKQEVTEGDWQRLFSSEGYVRLKKRELAMQRSFEDEEFRKFVLSETLLEKAAALEETLRRWKQADLSAAAERAFAYLPASATIRARVYPSIKPRENSFVFEVNTDPAIFLYLDPAITREEFENTVAHEFHHIGFGTGCNPPDDSGSDPKTAQLRKWMTAFGEGFATLAAGNAPDGHPRPSNRPEQRAEWDKQIARYAENQRSLEEFFLQIAEGKLSDDTSDQQAYGFFGLLGPWYTVGWKMAMTIEEAYGREKLIESFCDTRQLFSTYNRAVKETKAPLPLWSEKLVQAAGGVSPPGKR